MVFYTVSGFACPGKSILRKMAQNQSPCWFDFFNLTGMSAGVIFYCDDDDDDLMIFLDIIKQIDPELQCITANDCEDALQMLSSGNISPDMIFLDINMPKMSGIELLAWMKRYHALQEVPIIMYSTSLNKRETDYCSELGASAVIPKLFSLEESIKQLREAIGTYLPMKQKKD